LSHLNMSVKAPSGDPTTGQWSVSDNKQLLRFADGMIIRSKGPVTAGEWRRRWCCSPDSVTAGLQHVMRRAVPHRLAMLAIAASAP